MQDTQQGQTIFHYGQQCVFTLLKTKQKTTTTTEIDKALTVMHSTPPMTVKCAFTLLRGGSGRGGERGGERERERERENSNRTEPRAYKERCSMGMNTAETRSIRQPQRSINKYTSHGVFQSCQADRSSC